MSSWSILPADGPLEGVLFTSRTGALTRADVVQRARARTAEWQERAGSNASESPIAAGAAALLTDVLAAWPSGQRLVLEPGGGRVPFTGASRGGARASTPFGVHPEQVVVELFTSGTTGRPERYEKTAAQLLGEARVLGPLLDLGPECVVLSTVPLHHLYGLLFGLLAPLQAGARMVDDVAAEPARFHPHRVAAAVDEFGVTHLVTIPAHIRSLVDAAVPLPGLRAVVSSAAFLPRAWAAQLEELCGARVLDVLGSTETGGIAIRRTATDSSYQPLPGVSVRIGADEHLEVTSPYCGGEGTLRTGDRARWAPGGRFEHLGRDDGVVKVGGRRFSLQELEAKALEIPGVSDALAFSKPTDSARGSEVWLVVASAVLDRAGLHGELAARVDPLLIPRRLRVLGRLPRDERGKLPRSVIQRYVSLPGFDLVDLSLTPFRLELSVRKDSPRFAGHFPGAPVLPAVAQLLDLVAPEVERLSGACVQAARRLKWQAPVLPGQLVVLTIEAASPVDYRFRLATPDDAALATGLLSVAADAP